MESGESELIQVLQNRTMLKVEWHILISLNYEASVYHYPGRWHILISLNYEAGVFHYPRFIVSTLSLSIAPLSRLQVLCYFLLSQISQNILVFAIAPTSPSFCNSPRLHLLGQSSISPPVTYLAKIA